jgi:hypothetical protein
MRSLARALVVAVLAGGPLVLAPASVTPVAGAATCTSAGGVSVVVDFRELGGSTITACAADGGGRSAAEIFASVGVDISYATRQPGFVCRVEGAPAGDPCVNASPASAYWGLWWADGSKASWSYSSSGVGGLTVPAGGSVGWSWQQDRENSGAVPPGVLPPVAATPTPSPTASPTTSASASPTATPSGGGGSTGGGSTGGAGGSTGGGGSQPTTPSPTSGSTGSSTSPQATPSGAPAAPSESPLASESPGDSRPSGGSGDPSDDPSLDDESPGDSTSSGGSDPSASASESPGDSSASSATEAGSPTADEPARVPAAVTWGIVGLLAVAIAVSAVVARRRRGV